jgi:hypothetical protein
MNTLIERYMAVVLDRTPERKRSEVGDDVRGAIAEMVDQRVMNGEPEDAAVRSALNELGDPGRLAAAYGDGPAYLIGPGWYPAYIEVLKRVFGVAVALTFVISMVVTLALDEGDIGDAVTGALDGGFNVAVHVLLWVTLGFAVAERTSIPAPSLGNARWSVDDLPAVGSDRQITRGDALPTLVALGIMGTLLIVQHVRGVGLFSGGNVDDPIAGMPLINPDLGAAWVIGFFALLLVAVTTAVSAWREGFWTRRLTALTILDSALWVAFVVALAFAEPIVNPELVAEFDGGNPDRWAAGGPVNLIAIIAVASVALPDAWGAYRGHQRYRRMPGPA